MPATLPLLDVLESVLSWSQDPSPERAARIATALRIASAIVGVDGGRLAVDSLTPRLAVGWGPDAETERDPALGRLLRGHDGATVNGCLWLDHASGDVGQVVRGVELAVDAATSRAEIQATAARLEALDEATRAIAGVLSVERVLQVIVDRVRRLIGAQYAALGIVDEHGVMERFVTSGISAADRARIGALPRGHGLLGLIVRENRTYLIPDIAHHPDSSGFPPDHPPMTSFLGVPIVVKGRSVGNFYLTDKRTAPEFSAVDERLVEMFALHAGVAIENARLHEQVQRMAVVDERARISKELHDGIIQALYGVGLSLEDVPDLMHEDPDEAVARVDRAIDSLNGTIRDIRNFIFGLRPELVEQGDLAYGLGLLVNEFRLNTVIDIDLEVGEGTTDLAADRRAEALQLVREALSNVARHSGASLVSVAASGTDELLAIAVVDNGRGFDQRAFRDPSHHGLQNMQARAERLGGTLTVESTLGGGTRIELRLPVREGLPEPTDQEEAAS